MGKNICKHFQNCPMKKFYEAGKLDEKWIQNYCFKNGKNCVRYKLEEEEIYHPDNMLPNGEINKELN